MTLYDLILAAGGTKDSACYIKSEITRVGINEDQAFVEHLKMAQVYWQIVTNLTTFL